MASQLEFKSHAKAEKPCSNYNEEIQLLLLTLNSFRCTGLASVEETEIVTSIISWVHAAQTPTIGNIINSAVRRPIETIWILQDVLNKYRLKCDVEDVTLLNKLIKVMEIDEMKHNQMYMSRLRDSFSCDSNGANARGLHFIEPQHPKYISISNDLGIKLFGEQEYKDLLQKGIRDSLRSEILYEFKKSILSIEQLTQIKELL